MLIFVCSILLVSRQFERSLTRMASSAVLSVRRLVYIDGFWLGETPDGFCGLRFNSLQYLDVETGPVLGPLLSFDLASCSKGISFTRSHESVAGNASLPISFCWILSLNNVVTQYYV